MIWIRGVERAVEEEGWSVGCGVREGECGGNRWCTVHEEPSILSFLAIEFFEL